MRLFGLIFLLLLSSPPATAAVAQAPVHRAIARTPVALRITLPAGKPELSAQGLLLQAGAGILGGIAGMTVVGIPLALAHMGSPVSDDLMATLLATAYVAGTTAGIHHVGRWQGMSGNPWATAAGALGGLAVSGAMMQPFIDDEGDAEGPAPLLVLILPSVGGTSGYSMTRRSR